jgi:hypothetical protein
MGRVEEEIWSEEEEEEEEEDAMKSLETTSFRFKPASQTTPTRLRWLRRWQCM